MLIKLIRPTGDSTVEFSISFTNLPYQLQIPPAWTNQIAILNMDDLDLPNVLHALDKSASATALLLDVIFDIPAQMISCVFVDGSTEEWSFIGNMGLNDALENVVRVVDAAAAESVRERERQVAKQRWREHERERLLSMSMPAPVTYKPNKHKKQRSLLMTLVATLVPSVRSPPPPLLHPSSPPPTPPPHLTFHSLRTIARAVLVDTYRRYVVTELARRSLSGGYYTWVIKSMLRRISENLDDLVREARGTLGPAHSPMQHRFGAVEYLPALLPPSPSPSPPPSSLDDGSEDTDTDGSSVHTPSTSFSTPNTSNASVSSPTQSSGLPAESDMGRTVNGEECFLNPEALAMYNALSENAVRLRSLLMLADAKAAHEDRETRARETMLEVRCRRRAWLSKRLATRGVSVGMAGVDLGMAAPFERSPLGLHAWTAADIEEDVEEQGQVGVAGESEDEGQSVHIEFWSDRTEYGGRGSLRQRLGLGESRLFPVSEVEEEEGLDDEGALVAREMALDMDFELEVGSDWVHAHDGDPSPLDLVLMERPKARPRMRLRTNSMHMRRRHLEAVDLPLPLPKSLSPSSLLCSPLKGCHGVGSVPDVECVPFLDHEEEFTLSMDLPRRRSMKSVDGMGGYEREEMHERRWMSPALGIVVDCR